MTAVRYQLKLAVTQPGRIPEAFRRRLRSLRHRSAYKLFHAAYYIDITERRLEHLASVGLPLSDRTVLEVGAGIGDLTGFFLDRGCEVMSSDARPSNVEILARRRPTARAMVLDLDAERVPPIDDVDIVFAYGVLYHLRNPARAIALLAEHCRELMLVETSVADGDSVAVFSTSETMSSPTQAVGGLGSRPTRSWVHEELSVHFPYVYTTVTQPWGHDFPLDWNAPRDTAHRRAIFVASRAALDLPTLTADLPTTQRRH